MASKETRLLELKFPVGGLDRSGSFQTQPPYTTPYCLNVRPFDVVNLDSAAMHGMRQRGGARPGLSKYYEPPCGAGPIQLLDFAAKASPYGATNYTLLAVCAGTLYQNASGAMVAITSGLNTTAAWLCGTQVGRYYYIADHGAVVLSGTNASIQNNNEIHDALIPASGIDPSTDYCWVSPNVTTQENIFPIASVAAGKITLTGYTGGTGKGYTMTLSNQESGVVWAVGRLPKVFDPENPTTALSAICGGTFPIPPNTLTAGTVYPRGDGSGYWSPGSVLSIVDGVVTGHSTAWTYVPTPSGSVIVTLELANKDGIGTRSYNVASIGGDTQITLSDTTIDFTGPASYFISWTSSIYGVPPVGCPLCCTYRGRLVLAGPGPVWYMSRVLNPNDWDYGYDVNDPSRAVGGPTALTGGIPAGITALLPHGDNYLIFGCERSLWLLTGDPAYGGSITSLSREVGVVGPKAWCNLPDGSILFLSRDGLYQIPSGAPSSVVSFSRSRLPVELIDADPVGNTVSMIYDTWARGVHLFITPTTGLSGTHYFIDTVLGGFWPVSFTTSTMQPTDAVQYAVDSSHAAAILFASYDGYLRYYDPDATDDDGTDISSVVCYGPIQPGGPGWNGEILQISGDLDTVSQDVDWGIFAGGSAQASVAAAVAGGTADKAPWHGSWSAGPNHRQFPRCPGVGLVIMVSGTYGWAIEAMRIEVGRKGPYR